MTPDDHKELLAWAGNYWVRTTSSSVTGHERLYRAFTGDKAHLRSRNDVTAFVPP